jgi:hypothetical protein
VAAELRPPGRAPCPGAARGARDDGSTRAAGAESRAAETRAQGHLTSYEPEPEPEPKPGRQARGHGRTPHGPCGLRPPVPPQSSSGDRDASSLRLRSCLRLPRLSPPRPPELRLRRLRLLPGRGRVLPLLRPRRASYLLLHFSAPHAEATSCHRLSSQHGGGCGGLSASRVHGDSAPTPRVPRPRFPPSLSPRTPSASQRRPPSSITGNVVHAGGGGEKGPPNASSSNSKPRPP